MVLVEAAAQIEVVGVVLAERLGDLAHVGVEIEGLKRLAVGIGDLTRRSVLHALALVVPLADGDVGILVVRQQRQVTVQRVVDPRQLVVGEIAQQVLVVAVFGDGRDSPVDHGVEARIEDHRQIEAVTLPSGLLVLAAEVPAVLSAVHAHRVHDHRVGHRMLRLADRVHVRPRAQPVETVAAQHLLLVGGPCRGRSELLFEGLLLTVRTARRKDGHGFMDVGPSLGIDQPPAVTDLLRAEEPGSLLPVDHPAAVDALFGVAFPAVETRKAVDGLRLVALPLGLLRILPGLDLPVLRGLGREASDGQHGGRQKRQSVHESFHTAIRSYRSSRPATRSRRRARGCGTSAYRWRGRSAPLLHTCT